MTAADRMWVAYWALLILANVDSPWWMGIAIPVLILVFVLDAIRS